VSGDKKPYYAYSLESYIIIIDKHKREFDEKCLELVDQREQARLQWLPGCPDQRCADNVNSITA
jgi:hypothetical protein